MNLVAVHTTPARAANRRSATVVQLPAGASKTLVTPSITIAGTSAVPTGKLDLTNNALVVDYSGDTPAGVIRQLIVAGRGGPGFGKGWNGQGITSSAAAMAEPESRSVGYADNWELPLGPYTNFRSQPVDDSSVLSAFMRTGDANLDGIVNNDDVTIVGASYSPGVARASWALGDFDYNGVVDDDDVTLLGAFYDPLAPPRISPLPLTAGGVTAVPEPSALITCIAGAALVVRQVLFAVKARKTVRRETVLSQRVGSDRRAEQPR